MQPAGWAMPHRTVGNGASHGVPTSTNAERGACALPAASSSILYTLLQDLRLTATAQALCEELEQQQQQRTAAVDTVTIPNAALQPPQASHRRVVTSPTRGTTAVPASSITDPIRSLPRNTSADQTTATPTRDEGARPVNANHHTLQQTTQVPAATRATSQADGSTTGSATDLQQALQPNQAETKAAAALVGLAACAIEPLEVLRCPSPSQPAGNITTIAPRELEELLSIVWQDEQDAVDAQASALGARSTGQTVGRQWPSKRFTVVSLIARAAWCELRVTELVFLQEHHLAHLGTSPPSGVMRPLKQAQSELVDYTGQLVAALQELRMVCGAAPMSTRRCNAPTALATDSDATMPSLVTYRLRSQSLGWLHNAECVMAWVMRRQSAFEFSVGHPSTEPQHQQQRKRQCLEHHPDAAAAADRTAVPLSPVELGPTGENGPSGVDASRLVRQLQEVVLHLPHTHPMAAGNITAATNASSPSATSSSSYQAFLAIEQARSKTRGNNGGTVAQNSSRIATPRDEIIEPSVLSSVRIPLSLRVAMMVQRVKLLLALMASLVYNGKESILGDLLPLSQQQQRAAGNVEVVRAWWARQCAMQARFLLQCARQLNLITAASPLPSPATPSLPRVRAMSAASEATMFSLSELFETQARELVFSPYPLCATNGGGASPSSSSPPPPVSPLMQCVRVLSAMEQRLSARSARLDRFSLRTFACAWGGATAASSPLSAAADVVFSPTSAKGSPSWVSEASPVNSPLWTRSLPSPPSAYVREKMDSSQLAFVSAHRGSVGSGGSYSVNDPLDVARTATRVLEWKSSFTQLLTTIATGRWQAQFGAPQMDYPGSRYHRLRLRLISAVQSAQELLRLQPRQMVGADGSVYPAHPTLRNPNLGEPLSVVEQLPRALQVATLQDARALRRRVKQRLARAAAVGHRGSDVEEACTATCAAPPTSSSALLDLLVGGSHSDGDGESGRLAPTLVEAAAAALLHYPTEVKHASNIGREAPADRRVIRGARWAASLSEPPPEGRGGSRPRGTSVETPSASHVITAIPLAAPVSREPSPALPVDPESEVESGAVEPATLSPVTRWEEEYQRSSSAEESSEEGGEGEVVRAPRRGQWHVHEEEGEEGMPQGEAVESATSTDRTEEEDWVQTEEEEEELDDGEGGSAPSEASSADMDYDRVEDAMKEEVECVEVTTDGRLLAFLTTRGRLTVLRLLAGDSTRHYEEEVLLDSTLPHMPSRETRLQWYESLSSFVHFSPCHRFVLAAVQLSPKVPKPSSTSTVARTQLPSAGEISIYSLHRDHPEGDQEGPFWKNSTAANPLRSVSPRTASERLRGFVSPLSDRLYRAFSVHDAPCLSARWLDPRWWGGGRRSRWANSAVEPLNSTKAADAMLEREANEPSAPPALEGVVLHRLPHSWQAAAGVLLSEYQCLSVGIDDMIVRWLPSSGVVLQRIRTEPVQDLIVSPLMAAFYVLSDAGDLYMYDAWDEQSVYDDACLAALGGGEEEELGLMGVAQRHRTILPVTDDGHPLYRSVIGVSQPQGGPAPHRRVADDKASSTQAHPGRTSAHFLGAVTPVFQRVVDPIDNIPQPPAAPHRSNGSAQHRHHHQHRDSGTAAALAATATEASSSGGFSEEDEEGGIFRASRDAERPLRERETRNSSNSLAVTMKKSNDNFHTSVLPRQLRWLLPRRWAAHTPWDVQLGRRIIQHMLRQTSTPTTTEGGELLYESDTNNTRGLNGASLGNREGSSDQPPLSEDAVMLGRTQRDTQTTANGSAAAAMSGAANLPGEVAASRRPDNEEDTLPIPSSSSSSSSEKEVEGVSEISDSASEGSAYAYTVGADYDDDDDGGRRPLPPHIANAHGAVSNATVALATAVAKGIPVPLKETAAHPTPARGPLQRAYYPCGSCLVYKSVANALCNAGDLSDRQRNHEMGPGGPTHHLLSFAFSGEPQWKAERRLLDPEAEEGTAAATTQKRFDAGTSGAAEDIEYGDATSEAAPHPSHAHQVVSAPFTQWSTAALARVLLWRDHLCPAGEAGKASSKWESDVLSTTYHADVMPSSHTRNEGEPLGGRSEETPRWSAAEVLMARGYVGPRDAWRRCAPTAQLGLAPTARNGRYLCIMASVGPYRKLVSPREPLCEIEGFYACVVFDVYAGAVLHVLPVCPVDLSGLRGQNMRTSDRHERDLKTPLYRLPCTVTVMPVAPLSSPRKRCSTIVSPLGGARPRMSADVTGVMSRRPPSSSSQEATDEEYAELGEEEGKGEPTEIVAVTVGGLGNALYIFDAINGRRLVHADAITRRCGENAAAAHQASTLAARARARQQEKVVSPLIHGSARSPWVAPAGAAPTTSSLSTLLPTYASEIAKATPPRPTRNTAVPSSPSFLAAAACKQGSVLDEGMEGPSIVESASVCSPTHLLLASPSSLPRAETGNGDGRYGTKTAGHTAAVATALSEALAQSSTPVPWLLRGPTTTASQRCGWHLRGVLWWVHKHPQPTLVFMSDDGSGSGGNAAFDLHWKPEDAASTGQAPHTSADMRKHANGKGGGAQPAVVSTAASSALSFFYKTFFGVPGTIATPTSRAPPANPSTSVNNGHPQHRELSNAALSGAAWRQRRRRLLERMLRHYDVGMLWQAYVSLFATSITGTGSLAPQSAVSALVQWALSTERASVDASTAAALLGSTDGSLPWVWCASHAQSILKNSRKPSGVVPPSRAVGCSKGARSEDLSSGIQGISSTVPFAHVLQEREEFMMELQERDGPRAGWGKSAMETVEPIGEMATLLSALRANAMADGSMPLTGKMQTALQGEAHDSPAAATSTTAIARKLPPLHHQNQLHVDVVNCVATWLDANGGFYICSGSEDGGLYIMGGHVGV